MIRPHDDNDIEAAFAAQRDHVNRDLAEYGRYRDVVLFEDTPWLLSTLDNEPSRIPWSLMTPLQKSDEMARSSRLAYRKQHGKDPIEP